MVLAPEKNKANEMSCVHHWLIEEARAPVSEGRCRKCGVVKNFDNYTGKRTRWNQHPRASERIAA